MFTHKSVPLEAGTGGREYAVRRHTALLAGAVVPWLLIGAITTGAAYRLVGLSSIPLGYDEAATVEICRGPLTQIYELNKTANSSPPLPLFLLHWSLMFGDSESIVRLVPFLAGVLLIPAVYIAAKQAWLTLPDSCPDTAALCGAIASLLCALAPPHALLSREVRVYSLGALITAVALALGLWYWRKPSFKKAVAVGAVIFFGLQVQYGLAFFFAALYAALALGSLYASVQRRRLLSHAVVVAALFAAGLVIVYLTSLRFQFYVGRGVTYAPSLGTAGPFALTARIANGSWKLLYYAYPSDLFVVFLLFGIAIGWSRQRLNSVAITVLTTALLMAAASAKDLYLFGGTRQCLFLTVPLYVLAAMGLVSILGCLPTRQAVYGLACAGLVLIAPVLLDALKLVHRVRAVPNFRTAMATIDRDYRPGDVIFIPPGTLPIYEYYARRFTPKDWVKGEGGEIWLKDERFWKGLIPGDPPYTQQLSIVLASQRRVWLLYSHYHPNERQFGALSQAHGWSSRVRTLIQQPDEGDDRAVNLMIYE